MNQRFADSILFNCKISAVARPLTLLVDASARVSSPHGVISFPYPKRIPAPKCRHSSFACKNFVLELVSNKYAERGKREHAKIIVSQFAQFALIR
jgi:hypothetical protein